MSKCICVRIEGLHHPDCPMFKEDWPDEADVVDLERDLAAARANADYWRRKYHEEPTPGASGASPDSLHQLQQELADTIEVLVATRKLHQYWKGRAEAAEIELDELRLRYEAQVGISLTAMLRQEGHDPNDVS